MIFLPHDEKKTLQCPDIQSRGYMRCVRCGGARPSPSGGHSRVARRGAHARSLSSGRGIARRLVRRRSHANSVVALSSKRCRKMSSMIETSALGWLSIQSGHFFFSRAEFFLPLSSQFSPRPERIKNLDSTVWLFSANHFLNKRPSCEGLSSIHSYHRL